MASFSVDITDVILASAHSGYKDITIIGMPQAGVNCTITGTNASSFGYRIPGSDQNVYRVYSTATETESVKNAVFRITNLADSTDYVEVQLHQLKYGYFNLDGNIRGNIFDVICDDTNTMINAKQDLSYATGSFLWVFFNKNNGGYSTAHCTVLLDGGWTIPTGSNVPSWIALTSDLGYTDTGFKKVYISCVNNYDGPRQFKLWFGDNNYLNYVLVMQDGYPGTTSGCTETLSVPKNGGTFTTTLKHPSISESYYPHIDEWEFHHIYGTGYSTSRVSKTTNESTFSITLPENTTGEEIKTFVYYLNSSTVGLGHTVIIQAGDSPTPTLTVDPSVLSYPASGGGRTLDVTYATPLSTNISSFPSWLSGTYVSVAQGEGQYTITAASNTSTSSRSFNFELEDANMSLAVPITQAGGDPASLSISPTSNSVSSSSGSVQITVTSSGISSVQYNISDSWITYSGKSGSVYTFNYTAKSTTGQRTGTITFYGGGLSETYTLVQAGASQIVVSPTSESVGSTSGSTTVYLSGPSVSSVSYSVSQDAQSWMRAALYPPYFLISYDANTSSSSRTGVVTFSASDYVSGTYTLTQAGGTLAPFSVSPTELYFNWERSVDNKVDVLFNGSVSASPSSNVSSTRVSISGGYRYSVSMTLSSSSLSPFSTGYITFSPEDGSSRSTTVQCYGNYMYADPIEIDDVPAAGNTYQVTVFYPNARTAGVSLKDKSSFISSVTRSTLSTNYAIFDVVVSTNNTGTARSGYVKFYATGPVSGGSNSTYNNITVAINQLGGSVPTPEIVVSPTSDSVSSSSGSVSITASGASNISYSISQDAQSWLSYVSGSSYTFNYTANTSTDQRIGYITFSASGATPATYTLVQAAGSAAITISPTAQTVGSSTGTVGVTVSGGSDVYYNIRPQDSWITYVGKSGNVYTFRYADNSSTSTRTGLIGFAGSGSSGSAVFTLNQNGVSPGPTPVDTRALRAYPSELVFYGIVDGGSRTVWFENIPQAGIGSTITYTNGSGWLSIEDNGNSKYVYTTANSGSARRASIRFYDLNDSSNYVIVPVVQGGANGYNSIWMDIAFHPQNRDADNNYYYRIVMDEDIDIFTGVSSVPSGWGPTQGPYNTGGIDIPRLVENSLYSRLYSNTSADWVDMYGSYCTAKVYNMTQDGYPGVVDATYKFYNDWSRFVKRYDYTRCLNDPINGRGCDNMVLPFCVYYDSNDAFTFSIVEEEDNGNINTYTYSAPENPFSMRLNSFYNTKRLDYKQGNDIIFSYDMNHCGSGYFLYRNRFGGWDSFLLEGNIIKTDNYTKQNYRLKGGYSGGPIPQDRINNVNYIDEKKVDDIDIDKTYQVYTGWLTDDQAERLAFHLLSSPIVYFEDLNSYKDAYNTDYYYRNPVRITNSSAEYKKFKNGKRLVNYLITFEKCNIEKVKN